MKYRFENFGGIIASQAPPFLAFVDRDYMRELGLGESTLWDAENESIDILSAPTEVHFAITNQCSVKCPHCYMSGGEKDEGELDTNSVKRALDVLSEMKVFHVAFGGGEALERPDLFEIAKYAWAKGLVPNLTVSGVKMTNAIAEKMRIFGQVNVSVDGVRAGYGVFRGKDMFAVADKALEMLISADVPTGINCVVGRRNFNGIRKLFGYAKKKGLNEIEFLRFKPSGRAKHLYLKERTTYEQNISLTPMLARLSAEFGISAKIDCSFVPMFCYHNPPREMLESTATYGCEAGNVLWGIRSDGFVSGCSFLESTDASVFDIHSASRREELFRKMTTWIQRAPEPCRSCAYLDICKGGCHAVSKYVTGDFDSPDPDCPFVIDYKKKEYPDG